MLLLDDFDLLDEASENILFLFAASDNIVCVFSTRV